MAEENDMADDLIDGYKKHYYQRSDGTIVRVFSITLQHGGKPEIPFLKVSVIKGFKQHSDICQGEITIPLLTYELIKYKRISDVVIENLRAKYSQLEASAQSQPSCTKPERPNQKNEYETACRQAGVPVSKRYPNMDD